jgi:hypothetical protein
MCSMWTDVVMMMGMFMRTAHLHVQYVDRRSHDDRHGHEDRTLTCAVCGQI